MMAIDSNAVNVIRALLRPRKPVLLTPTVSLIAKSIQNDVSQLLSATNVADTELVRKTVRSVKSCSAYLGAIVLTNSLSDREIAVCKSHQNVYQVLSHRLQGEIDIALDEIQEYVEQAA